MEPNTSNLPILLFVFANDRRQDGSFLKELVNEKEQIETVLEDNYPEMVKRLFVINGELLISRDYGEMKR